MCVFKHDDLPLSSFDINGHRPIIVIVHTAIMLREYIALTMSETVIPKTQSCLVLLYTTTFF